MLFIRTKQNLPNFGVIPFSSQKTVLKTTEKKEKKKEEKCDVKLGHLSAWKTEVGHLPTSG